MGEIPGHPNLTPFQPGQSGNPAGRPPGIGLEEKLNRALTKQFKEDPEHTNLDEWVKAILTEIIEKPSSKASMAVLDRRYPNIIKHEHSTPPGESLKIENVPTVEGAAEALDILGDVGGADET